LGSRGARQLAYRLIDNAVWLVLALILIAFSVLIDGFASPRNLTNILYHSCFVGILAIPLTFVLISRNIDLSIGSVAGLAAIVSAWLAGSSVYASGVALDPYLALALVLGIGGAVGLVNGFVITRFGVDSFLMTLATLIIVQGLALVITEGRGVSLLPDSFRLIDTIRPAGVPLMVFLASGLYVLFEWVLRRTQFGRHLYVVGGNRDAGENFGIRVQSVIVKVFVFSGIMAAFTGWLLAARLNGASPGVATTLLFDVLAACVIGGVSLRGGVGSLVGVLGGVLLLGALTNALSLMAVSPFVVDVLRGTLILAALLLDSMKRRVRL
jgi:ribose/xylose/arabinose/galactoside ABC-type transport system permease subunit